MEKITGERCIELMNENFPGFRPYWETFVRNGGLEDGLTIQVIPFGDYAIDIVRSDNEIEAKKIFEFIDFLLDNGDQSVGDAIATGLLEYLINKDPHEFKFSKFVPYLGSHARDYCRAWDEFCGVRTDGLWTEEEKRALKIEAQINDLEGYRVATCFLEKQQVKTRSRDIRALLGKMPFINSLKTADPNWKNWKECIRAIKSKTKRGGFDIVEAYQTLQCFLGQYNQVAKSKDIDSLLMGMDLLEYKSTRDPALWRDWIECVNSCINWEKPVK